MRGLNFGRSTATLVVLGFVAGALATLTLHQLAIGLLYALGAVQNPPYSLRPIPPLGVPSVLNLAFWGGVWGIVWALVAERMPRRWPIHIRDSTKPFATACPFSGATTNQPASVGATAPKTSPASQTGQRRGIRSATSAQTIPHKPPQKARLTTEGTRSGGIGRSE